MPKNNQDQLLHELTYKPKARIALFREIEFNRQGKMLLSLSRHVRMDILSRLNNHEIQVLLHYIDPDDATDILQMLPSHRRKNLVASLDKSFREKVEYLLKFNPKTAAGLMSLDYIQVSKDNSFDDVLKLVRKHEKRTGKTPAILVTHEGYLLGELTWRVIASHRKIEKIDHHVRKTPTVRYDVDQAEVVGSFKKNPHSRVVVLDDDNSIIGVIYSDDVIRIIRRQSGHDLYNIAGVREEESILDDAFTKVKHRYKWLILNLFTAFIAASVVSMFQDTISALVLLAVYMPVVAGMGGNAGTQALAVTVRGLALKEIDMKHCKKAVFNEITAGGINGIITGSLAAVVAVFFNKSPMLGVVIGMAMIINLMIAGFFGAIVPLIMKTLGKDPATSATVFITTATDVCGFFVFLGMAQALI